MTIGSQPNRPPKISAFEFTGRITPIWRCVVVPYNAVWPVTIANVGGSLSCNSYNDTMFTSIAIVMILSI